jgi:hypothetical protein
MLSLLDEHEPSADVNQSGRSYVDHLGSCRWITRRAGIVETRVEALVENLAVVVMQANNLAADSPEYEALAKTLAYALDLADLSLSVESNAFDALEPPKAR